MFVSKFVSGLRRERKVRTRAKGVDMVTKQVRQVLQTADQKLILMVRG